MDARDKLILSLSALLHAERATRSAFESAIEMGVVEKEVLLAILGDPVPVVTREDLNYAESFAATHTEIAGMR